MKYNNSNSIKQSNEERYSDISEVDNYLNKRYHLLRLQLARKMINKYCKQALDNKANFKVLDIAASTGFQSSLFQTKGYITFSADIEYKALQIARQKYDLNCVQIDVLNAFPFKSKSFNAIFAGEIIEHLFNVSKFLAECNRVLVANGFLVITTPNLASFQDRLKFFFGFSPRHIAPFHNYLKLHIRPFTKHSLSSALKRFGFNVKSVKSSFVGIHFGPHNIDFRLPAKIFPSIGSNLIVGASKRKDIHLTIT